MTEILILGPTYFVLHLIQVTLVAGRKGLQGDDVPCQDKMSKVKMKPVVFTNRELKRLAYIQEKNFSRSC